MITGYNTDVKHNSRVFHIQTEDKGDTSPYIESLVYVGGQILATRKTSYADIVQNGRDDRAVQEMMEQQHRTMIAAIQRGRFDGPNGSLKSPDSVAGPEDGGGPEEAEDASSPAEHGASGDRTLDQVILDYLASELAHEQIDCSFSPVPEFVGGQDAALRMKAVSSLSKQPVGGAVVQIRVLSTVVKPAVVFQGKTAADGTLPVSFRVPDYEGGTAAAVIRVSSSIGSTEFKFPVRRKS